MNTASFESARAAQRDYTESLVKQGSGFELVIGSTFVQGMREQGYRTTGRAINELIDNAMEAGATEIQVIADIRGREDSPNKYAVIDNGHGMEPDMVRASVIWGGTHRANSRTGIGRFGFGLPTSCVSQGRRYTVYSKVAGSTWHSVTIDLDDIAAGNVQFEGGRIIVDAAKPDSLPAWLVDSKGVSFDQVLESGTIVVVEKLDRLKPRKWTTLKRDLLQFFGVTYRNFLRECSIFVDNDKVLPVDPLFLMPNGKDYELAGNPHKAIGRPGKTFKVKTQDGDEALVTMRCSLLPPGFATKSGRWGQGQGENARFQVLKENQGLIVLRNGRQMDTVFASHLFPDSKWSFLNNDRYWKVEIDFSAALDEEFGVTTNKQQVVLSDRIWQVLKDQDLFKTMEGLRKECSRMIDEAKQTAEDAAESNPEEPRPSEQVLAEAEKYRRTPQPETPEQTERRQRKLQEEIDKIAEETGMPREEVAQKTVQDTFERPYRVVKEDVPGGPFFRVDVFGAQMRLYINKAHSFFSELYAHPETTPRVRAGMEVMLFVLGSGVLDRNPQLALFYQSEIPEWSNRLSTLLTLLKDSRNHFDEEEAEGTEAQEQVSV